MPTMKSYLFAIIVAGTVSIEALPNDNIFARQAACNKDNCYRAVIASPTRLADCSSFVSVSVTPCTSTITDTVTMTATATASIFPMKRHIIEARQESCIFTTNSPTSLPVYATSLCTAIGTQAPAARLSSACSCNGVTAVTTTLATPLTTVTTTTTVSTTVTPTPSAFILQSSGDSTLYVTLDNVGALRLTRDTSSAVPFYVDNSGQLRNLHNPTELLVDYYMPNSATADNTVYNAVPGNSNYAITCEYRGSSSGAYWGDCSSSGPPNGNPVVYGFGTCPNEGYYVYMIPNDSNVRCFDGGYAFLGFFLEAYTGN